MRKSNSFKTLHTKLLKARRTKKRSSQIRDFITVLLSISSVVIALASYNTIRYFNDWQIATSTDELKMRARSEEPAFTATIHTATSDEVYDFLFDAYGHKKRMEYIDGELNERRFPERSSLFGDRITCKLYDGVLGEPRIKHFYYLYALRTKDQVTEEKLIWLDIDQEDIYYDKKRKLFTHLFATSINDLVDTNRVFYRDFDDLYKDMHVYSDYHPVTQALVDVDLDEYRNYSYTFAFFHIYQIEYINTIEQNILINYILSDQKLHSLGRLRFDIIEKIHVVDMDSINIHASITAGDITNRRSFRYSNVYHHADSIEQFLLFASIPTTGWQPQRNNWMSEYTH